MINNCTLHRSIFILSTDTFFSIWNQIAFAKKAHAKEIAPDQHVTLRVEKSSHNLSKLLVHVFNI